jgi:medium-chain acyl-[acyl-carrier-protein] hydrolase
MIARPLASNPAILCPRPNPAAAVRLFCFPHAGGGASAFRRWPAGLPPEVELCAVQLPGHETRRDEPLMTTLAALMPALARDLFPFLDRPYAFFGHSMGALIAFELARHLRRHGARAPARLLLSAYRAPHLAAPHPPMHALPDAQFLRAISRLHGVPAEVQADAELMRQLLPVVRADVTVCETHAYGAEAPLACPISVFGGLDDPTATPGMLAAWRVHTRAGCAVRMLPGDHFFLQSGHQPLLRAIADDLRTLSQGTKHS